MCAEEQEDGPSDASTIFGQPWGMKQRLPDVGTSKSSGIVNVVDIMTEQVVTVSRSKPLGELRNLMSKHGIHSIPVVNGEQEPIGIVTSMDMLDGYAEETPVGKVMTTKVYTIPQYSGVHLAARMMRNHHIHHLVVTHEKRVVGLVSSFDLLRLVEDKRFVPKNRADSSKKKAGRRVRSEDDKPAK